MNTFTSRLFFLGAMPERTPSFRVDPGGQVVMISRSAEGGTSELPVTFARAADSIFRTWVTLQRIQAKLLFFEALMCQWESGGERFWNAALAAADPERDSYCLEYYNLLKYIHQWDGNPAKGAQHDSK